MPQMKFENVFKKLRKENLILNGKKNICVRCKDTNDY